MHPRLPLLIALSLLGGCVGDRSTADATASDACATCTADGPTGDGAATACVVDEDCTDLLGLPPVPEYPCGYCYASCSHSKTCHTLCFESSECVFTAGCGPHCEPLCDTGEDCLDDDECVEGVCEPPTQ